MFLSGFWHGAGYTFLAWGILHGIYLTINHAWRQWRPKWDKVAYERIMKPVGFVLTFVAVTIGMVLFRAPTTASALHILHGMAGLDGVSVPMALLNRGGGLASVLHRLGIAGDMGSGASFIAAAVWIVALFLIATLMPNSLELMRRYAPALYFESAAKPAAAPGGSGSGIPKPSWRVGSMTVSWTAGWAFLIAAFFVFGALGLSRPSEFLYWQF